MADRRSFPSGPRLDMQQLLMEAQHRWLRPAEICEILYHYQKFQITSEPPNQPPSGSLFLFDRKVLRYFRKDGHNWRKKKDGKTVKEAHEKLKVGSVDMLHCYYAHGEDNEHFQRRCYWMLEQDLMHIVFVHYLEVKGNKTNVGGLRETNDGISNMGNSSPLSFSFPENNTKTPSGITDSPSPTSTLTSTCEDADSGYDGEDSHQASSRSSVYFESPKMGNAPMMEKMDSGHSNSYYLCPSSDSCEGQSSVPGDCTTGVLGDGPRVNGDGNFMIESQTTLGLGSWEEVLEHCNREYDSVHSHAGIGVNLQQEHLIHGELLPGKSTIKGDNLSSLPVQSSLQIPLADNSLNLSNWNLDLSSNLEFAYDLGVGLFEQRTHDSCLQNASEPFFDHLDQQSELSVQNDLQLQLEDVESHYQIQSTSESEMDREGNINYAFSVKQKLLDGEGSLEKVDSFSRWVTKELEEVEDLNMQSSSGISWSTVECENVVENSSLSPSLSQDQLFSIIDFSPKWAITDSEIEVLVIGMFMKTDQEVTKCNWSCMFGEVEVPAEALADGVLCCRSPPHRVGQVPFYVTCSNRVACSEVREFEYMVGSVKDVDNIDICGDTSSERLRYMRLERLLSMRPLSPSNPLSEVACEKRNLIGKIISLKEEEESSQFAEPTAEQNSSQYGVKKRLLQKLMKERLYSWLLHKVIEDGKGPSILDDEGQGVLHLASALGYDWAIKPTVTAGVSINFRDINGWTALHWAAYCGREQTVAVLVSMGAASGALTDPSPEFPLCRTPADLASGNGHKGISGFLAESSLTSHLSLLTVNDSSENGGLEDSQTQAVQTVSERMATPVNDDDVSDVLLKDSLTAVCNATQAADRIHQVFRMQSFQRKQLEYVDDFGISDELALSLVAAKALRPGQGNGQAHAAAIQIQKKYRGWKKRKEFLLIRQRIVRIQAHVRGHQVRKQYKSITWSVGILEKVILRWRRKGSGLRGFRRDALGKNPDQQVEPLKEDDYDFLKEGRKQTEERLQKALGRVKSMVQYPEGRAQYRRLLNVVEGLRETKACDMVLCSSEETADDDEDLIEIDSLLNDDTFMSITFE